MRYQRGMSLLSVMVGLFLGALVMSAALRLVSELRRQGLVAQRQLQRMEEAEGLLDRLEKDLRRSGFCAAPCRRPAPPVQIAAMRGEPDGSCVLLAYDLDGDGAVEEAERFGWRLRQGALEARRSATLCDGSGWERVSDERRWRVESLRIVRRAATFHLTLSLAERRYPDTPLVLRQWLSAPNLARNAAP
ncbi:prepilin-type N-terminal cleavage/methylation domain-containing protein [Edwardsiella ictaluri]|uniref:Prepilin-type N-terminal cleavage/methylation domain-containing protein n=1 Tax=Edwardsiella ictaluri TaxID=67780 RepID=A0ABY8GDF6_EDWIC|nr:prepilin-type N-terminal cleavage/methylation domain-containing protein [Edwardsiella ictaluri]WFN95423.1 prepilin-type N-terminal cleavage/methylation domain-containing protein [Edwardsiella ictaluri]